MPDAHVVDAPTLTEGWARWVKPVEDKLGPMPESLRTMQEQAFFMGAFLAAAMMQRGVPIETLLKEVGLRTMLRDVPPAAMGQS